MAIALDLWANIMGTSKNWYFAADLLL